VEDEIKIKVGDLVKYDPKMFNTPTLSQIQSSPFGWLKDDYEGTEEDWIGIVYRVDTRMWGSFGGEGYEILWSTGTKEKVYAFEVEKVEEI
tara:strand:+ start:2098 stop:2370 length:273 start_codon:yes stop_codon:yes gene_type:complete